MYRSYVVSRLSFAANARVRNGCISATFRAPRFWRDREVPRRAAARLAPYTYVIAVWPPTSPLYLHVLSRPLGHTHSLLYVLLIFCNASHRLRLRCPPSRELCLLTGSPESADGQLPPLQQPPAKRPGLLQTITALAVLLHATVANFHHRREPCGLQAVPGGIMEAVWNHCREYPWYPLRGRSTLLNSYIQYRLLLRGQLWE